MKVNGLTKAADNIAFREVCSVFWTIRMQPLGLSRSIEV